MNEPAVECLAACDDFAQREENLSPARHSSAVLPAFGAAPLLCTPARSAARPSRPPAPLPGTEFGGSLSPSRSRPSSAPRAPAGGPQPPRGHRAKTSLCRNAPG